MTLTTENNAKKIGILIEFENGKIKKAEYGVITAAREAGHELYALVTETEEIDCRESLQIYGIEKIVMLSSKPEHLKQNPVRQAKAIIMAMNHFGIHTLCGLTSPWGKDLLPRIAAALDAPLVIDCLHVNFADNIAQKPQYSGKTVADIKVRGTYYIFGIRPNVTEAVEAPCRAEIIHFETNVDSKRFKVKDVKPGASRGVNLSEADIIISGGRAMRNTENYKILYDCAEVLNAAVGASRVAVDAGWVPHAMQVGQTGATVNPKLYIACGISGSVQHFAGMKTAGIIVAVNTDPDANMMRNCDYGITGDLFEIVPIFTRQLKEVPELNQL
ncbi:electron transfer flavoprotein subunit alpha/FixB family protein [Desulfococcaceae bacterium HSG9]|nr:electron transfer flavoprotein subunit alpha/FixB family protein [Desulfococcaceae bacterium HSG9]